MSVLSFEQVSLPGMAGPRLDRVSFSIAAGECVFLLGPNGAGKSSVLRTALGLEQPPQGRVLIEGQPTTALTAKERARHLAWLPQQWHIEQALSAHEVVTIARFRFAESRHTAEAKAMKWLAAVGAKHFAERRLTELSGGEQQRVKFAALLAQETPFLLLDEPANHLDPAQQLDVYKLLGEQWRCGHGVLCVSHDINLVPRVGDARKIRLLGMRAGRVTFDTQLADAGLSEKLSTLYDIPFDRLERSATAGGNGIPFFAPSANTTRGT